MAIVLSGQCQQRPVVTTNQGNKGGAANLFENQGAGLHERLEEVTGQLPIFYHFTRDEEIRKGQSTAGFVSIGMMHHDVCNLETRSRLSLSCSLLQ